MDWNELKKNKNLDLIIKQFLLISIYSCLLGHLHATGKILKEGKWLLHELSQSAYVTLIVKQMLLKFEREVLSHPAYSADLGAYYGFRIGWT